MRLPESLAAPRHFLHEGQIEPSRGKAIVRNTGIWHLDVGEQQPADLDAHVAELFGRVNREVSAWATLSSEYALELFCVYFMSEADESVEASAQTLRVLGDLALSSCFVSMRLHSCESNRLARKDHTEDCGADDEHSIKRDDDGSSTDHAGFHRFLRYDEQWERIISDPRLRPKLEAFVKEALSEGSEPLDLERL